jgi:hypothetical protein
MKLWGLCSLVAFGVIVAGAPPSASGADPCATACDNKAGDCVDACEAKYSDPKPRVECKVECIEARKRCEKQCK